MHRHFHVILPKTIQFKTIMRILSLFILALGLFACQSTDSDLNTEPVSDAHIQLDLSQQPQWQKDDFRLVPITASTDWVKEQEKLAQYKVLSEALEYERFRVTEKKPYGRFEDSGAVNTLTVQNKTDETVFMMAGEVVQGGNQDRVIAEDIVMAPRSIQDISVFCVEKDRWTYEGDHALNEADKKVFAFRGYYNVAPGQIRRSVYSGSQQAVWDQVHTITSVHRASSSTSALAGLEGNSDFVGERTNYQRFFSDKLENNDQIIGFIAIEGNRILGGDIFGHPNLLNRQFEGLAAGYITDALSDSDGGSVSDAQLQDFGQQLINELDRKGFQHEGLMVHYSKLP